jgi:hypothetical protein
LSSFISSLYASEIKGQPAATFIKSETDLLILLCFAISVITSLIVLLVRALYAWYSNHTGVQNGRQFAEPISMEEYQEQATQLTRQEVRKLQKNRQYQLMKVQKGRDVANWNWQAREQRPMEEIEEEQDYLENVEEISHVDDNGSAKCQGKQGIKGLLNFFGNHSSQESDQSSHQLE